MRPLKTLLFTAIIAFITQIAWGQGHEVFSPDQGEGTKLVKIFPNPATDYLSIKFEAPLAKTIKLTLHNIIGNSLEVESEIVDDHEIRLKVKDLPAGVYLLALKEDGRSQSCFKFLKR